MYETVDRLLQGPPPGASEAELVDWIARLEQIKCTAEAVQAEAAVRLEEVARARQAGAGVPARTLGEGVGSQIALARRVSPAKGAKLLGLAKILLTEMPHTFRLMKAGLFSQWQATILARETACLSVEDRRVVDDQLCATGPNGEPAKAVSMGLRQLENAAKKLAITLDQASVVARAASAVKDRRVSLRPAPDTMTCSEPCCRSRTASPCSRPWTRPPTRPGPPVTSGPGIRSWLTPSSTESPAARSG